MLRHALIDHVEIAVGRIQKLDAGRAHRFDRRIDIVGETRDVLDAFAVVLLQVFVDLRFGIGRLVQRNAHDAVGCGHRLGQQAGLRALDVEIADLAEVEQALVIVRPLVHVAEIQIVGEVIDEGQPQPLGHHLRARQPFVVRVVDGARVVVAINDVQHAAADAFDHRRGDGLAQFLVGDWRGAVLQRLHPHPFGKLVDADRKTAGAGAVLGGEVGGEGIGIFVDQECAVALAIGADCAGLVTRHHREAHPAEVIVKLLRLPRRRGEFDELEAVDAHGIFERGDLHAGGGLCAHGRAS